MEKRCDYCIRKGLNHTGSGYFRKKWEKKVKKTRKEESEEGKSDFEGGREDPCKYDTAATHHTTNKYDRVIDMIYNTTST